MLPPSSNYLRISGPRNQFVLARSRDFRDLVESHGYVEPSGFDKFEGELALKALAQNTPGTLSGFLQRNGVVLPPDPSRFPPGGRGPWLLRAAAREHYGLLRQLAAGETATGASADPVKALLAVLASKRGGALDFGGREYRVIASTQWSALRRGGRFELLTQAEAEPLLQSMADEVRGDPDVEQALEDAARFLDGAAGGSGRRTLLVRKQRPSSGGAPASDGSATTPSRARRDSTTTDEGEPTIELTNVEAPTFVPGVETTDLSYSISGPLSKVASVTMIVKSIPATGDPAVVETQALSGPFPASDKIAYDGTASTPGGLITLKGSPYEVTFELVSKSGKKSTSKAGQLRLEVQEVKIVVDASGTLTVDDPFKPAVDGLIDELKKSGMPGDCEGRLIIDSPVFKISNGEMDDASSFTQYLAAYGSGPGVPMLATIKLKAKDGTGKRSPAALVGTRLLWDLKLPTSGDLDGALDARGMHPAAKTFVKTAASFEEAATDPNGATAHFGVGGLRAKAADRAAAGTLWFAGGDWALTAGAQRVWAAFTTCGASTDATADSAVYFGPGRLAGDVHSVRAVVDVDEALDVTAPTAPDGAPAPRRSNVVKLVNWRRVPVVDNLTVGDAAPLSLAPLTAEYKKAAMLVEGGPGLTPRSITAQWKTEYGAVVSGYAMAGTAFLDKALETDPDGYPVRYRSYYDYWTLVNPDAGFFGRLWKRIVSVFGSSDEDNYKKKCDDMWYPVMVDVAKRLPLVDQGITALKFGTEGPHNQLMSGASYTAGIAPSIPGLTTRTKAIFFQFTSGASARTFLHEVGHTLFLAHGPGHFEAGKQPPGYQPNAHDQHQTCMMSYASDRKNFCGLCFLKLGGWNYTKIKTDGNVTP
ncbi:MAG TPA: hypothetical protein VG319_08025 [Polyangia bacterium]|nr:hypothetical protein [Polyangia bacterium]